MEDISQRAQLNSIGAEGNGATIQIVVGDVVVEVVEVLGIGEEVEEDEDETSVDIIL